MRDAKFLAPDRSYAFDGRVIERIAKSVPADHSSSPDNHETFLANGGNTHQRVRTRFVRCCHDRMRSSIQSTLREQPRAVDLHEGVVIAKRRDHELSLRTVYSEVMRHAISFPSASVIGQREDRGLSKKVHGGDVLVQIREDWSQSLTGVQLL